jgi:phosphoserine phosphatase RsbU/P
MATSPQPTGPAAPRRHDIFAQLNQFWQRVTDGLEISQLWKQFRADARSSYRLYQRDFDARAPQRTWRHNFFHTAHELAWAILEKLTPARRVLLLLGIVLLVLPGGGFSYHGKSGDLEVQEFDFHFFGGVSLFILLMLEIADRVVMKRDLEIARDIQRWLLPATPPTVPGLAIAFATRAANTVAGDYYDAFQRPSSETGEPIFLMAVADVAGKSIPAALLMATFQASLKTLSETSCSLPELLAGMNHYACTNSQSGLRFTTAFVAEFGSVTKNLTYINAGHNAPILQRKSGTVERLSQGGVPLGILAEGGYQSGNIVFESGDCLVIFTDGLIEAVNELDQEYGELRLLNLLQVGAASTPDELIRRMMREVDIFVGETPQHDDITCMVVKVA